jgi:uncharacterized protein YkwD
MGAFAQVSVDQSVWEEESYSTYTWETIGTFEPLNQIIDMDAIDYPLLHAAVFFETNRQRSLNGLGPLKWNMNLEIAAYHHSRIMLEKKFFSHTSRVRSRRDTSDRGKLAGITNPSIAENIATEFVLDYTPGKPAYFHGKGVFSYDGNPDNKLINHTYASYAVELVDGWMNSPGHRRNILNTNALELGVGIVIHRDSSFNDIPKSYATQNFQWYNPITTGPSEDPVPPGW